MTANLQARRRIGLTATLIRDGRESDVFSLIGPKTTSPRLEGRGDVAVMGV